MLEQEFQYYKTHEVDLVRRYEGKYLGIVGNKIAGVFDTELAAYAALKTQYGLGKFLVQQAIPVKQDRIQRFHSRVAFR